MQAEAREGNPPGIPCLLPDCQCLFQQPVRLIPPGRLRTTKPHRCLKAIHRFTEELREAIGEPSLYNQSLGTVSNSYMYDRVKGREAASDDSNNGH